MKIIVEIETELESLVEDIKRFIIGRPNATVTAATIIKTVPVETPAPVVGISASIKRGEN